MSTFISASTGCFLFNVTNKMLVSQQAQIELRCPFTQLYRMICQASVSNFDSISSPVHKLQQRKHRVQNNGETQGVPESVSKVNACFSATTQPILVIF
ncbi:MAG: hypothetical protein GY858_09690 [Candidatus Omnitrophica bacterium]|nr:hypothetical protein [Candidatus Omnitrophota bacterium]